MPNKALILTLELLLNFVIAAGGSMFIGRAKRNIQDRIKNTIVLRNMI